MLYVMKCTHSYMNKNLTSRITIDPILSPSFVLFRYAQSSTKAVLSMGRVYEALGETKPYTLILSGRCLYFASDKLPLYLKYIEVNDNWDKIAINRIDIQNNPYTNST